MFDKKEVLIVDLTYDLIPMFQDWQGDYILYCPLYDIMITIFNFVGTYSPVYSHATLKVLNIIDGHDQIYRYHTGCKSIIRYDYIFKEFEFTVCDTDPDIAIGNFFRLYHRRNKLSKIINK